MQKLNKRSGSSLFLMEMILSILILALACTACIRIFAAAGTDRRKARELNHIQTLTVSAGEILEKIENFDGVVLFTRDTHETYYLDTQEGKKLPVPHCIRDTEGWQIRSELDALRKTVPIDKETFGSTDLAGELVAMNEDNEIESITFVGLCTDICVISNALLAKASLPEVPIIVDAKCCAGVTPESHENALKAMEACQIQIDR